MNFFLRNEGEIVGGFLSGLVALFAFYLGIRFQRRKEKKIYVGNLFSLLTELEWKKGTIDRLVRELNTIKKESVKEGEIITKHASTTISTENLLKIRDNIISFESVNSKVLLLLNVVINFSFEINPSLNFGRPIELIEGKDNMEQKSIAIEGYFSNLIESHVQKLQLAIRHLSEEVKSEVNKYPDSAVLKDYDI